MAFDLEKAIAAWRRPFEHNRAFSVEDLEELEGSLRDRVDALLEAGRSEEAAFKEALRRMGTYGTAEAEYRKVYWSKLRRQHQLRDELQKRLSMLTSYLKIAVRNLTKQKGYAFLNLVGLAVGLAAFILILLFVQHELSYDRFHENADRIYRVVQRLPGTVYLGTDRFAVTPALLARSLDDELPEITDATVIDGESALLSLGEEHFWEDGLWADAHFFDVFSFPLRQGNPESALAEPGSIVLTKSLARKMFGDENPIGRSLLFENRDTYTVTGITAGVPQTSHVKFEFVASIQSQPSYAYELSRANSWSNNAWYTYIRLAEGAHAGELEGKLSSVRDKYLYAGQEELSEDQRKEFYLQGLTDIHLRSQINNEIGANGDIKNVYLFSLIGLAILLLACVNYTNLALARSIKRAREVGMRKVIGAARGQLVRQFLGESVLMAFLALVLALGLAHLLQPAFGQLVERPIQINYAENALLLPGLLALVVLVGLISGSYPALIMASLRPLRVLTGARNGRGSRLRVQRMLIVGQYAVSIVLIAGSFVVYKQLHFVQQKDLGGMRPVKPIL